MSWQDWLLTFGTFVFIAALFPSILSKNKPALSTSLMTGSVLLVFSIVYYSLSLWFSTITVVVNGILWFVLAYQQFNRKSPKHTA